MARVYRTVAWATALAFLAWVALGASGLEVSGDALTLAGASVGGLLAGSWRFHRMPRPGPPPPPSTPLQRDAVQWLLACVPVLGWLVLINAPGIGLERRLRALWRIGLVVALLVGAGAIGLAGSAAGAAAVAGWLTLALAVSTVGGREWLWRGVASPLAPAHRPADPPAVAPVPDQAPPAAAEPPEQEASVDPAGLGEPFRVVPPDQLPGFDQVGGMADLKREIDETVGLLLLNAGHAEAYRITWNGVLLHGPPGTGKTFLAKAIAGEYGLNFIHVSTGDLVSPYPGESARNVEAAFAAADAARPVLLFFDEFDSVAASRADGVEAEAHRTVNQLLTSVEEFRPKRDLVVVAATNDLEKLDPAVIRPGRFDRHVRIDLPDHEARRAIFSAALDGRPCAEEIDLEELATRTAGLTPAAIVQAVELASLAAFKEAAAKGELVAVTSAHLCRALEERGGRDRPTVEDWTWDRLVLPPEVKAELRQLQVLIERPERARALGVSPPSGVLLAGPPGTGKTTVARVLAAQARCSFYAVSAADVTSKWLGESERALQRLFQRARENRPSIVFIDEVDAIASARGSWGTYDRQVNQLLKEIDGMSAQPGVFVLAATNRADRLDPALLRGGRLSRTITIPLPDRAGREQILRLLTQRMPTVAVDLKQLAGKTDGLSGADLNGLCQQAALEALVRLGDAPPQITQRDFERALAAFHKGRRQQGALTGP